jgi:hypothetical protein
MNEKESIEETLTNLLEKLNQNYEKTHSEESALKICDLVNDNLQAEESEDRTYFHRNILNKKVGWIWFASFLISLSLWHLIPRSEVMDPLILIMLSVVMLSLSKIFENIGMAIVYNLYDKPKDTSIFRVYRELQKKNVSDEKIKKELIEKYSV